jgi:hypothetical protein
LARPIRARRAGIRGDEGRAGDLIVEEGAMLEQSELRRELEGLLARSKPLGKAEASRGLVIRAAEPLARPRLLVDDPDAVPRPQPLGDRIRSGVPALDADGFRRTVESVDVVVTGVEEVTDFLDGGRCDLIARAPVVTQLRRQCGGLVERSRQPLVHGDHRPGHGRHVRRDLPDLRERDAGPEQRIRQAFAQFRDEPRFIVLRKQLHVDAEGRVQSQENRDRQRPLVVLDLVQIAER